MPGKNVVEIDLVEEAGEALEDKLEKSEEDCTGCSNCTCGKVRKKSAYGEDAGPGLAEYVFSKRT